MPGPERGLSALAGRASRGRNRLLEILEQPCPDLGLRPRRALCPRLVGNGPGRPLCLPRFFLLLSSNGRQSRAGRQPPLRFPFCLGEPTALPLFLFCPQALIRSPARGHLPFLLAPGRGKGRRFLVWGYNRPTSSA